jgi:hypothetical protein
MARRSVSGKHKMRRRPEFSHYKWLSASACATERVEGMKKSRSDWNFRPIEGMAVEKVGWNLVYY